MTSRLQEQLKSALFKGLRLAFRVAPLPERTRDRFRQTFLARYPSVIPQGPVGRVGGATPFAHRALARSDQPALGSIPYREEALPSPLPATLVAFYLPQFHSIPENDAWWGKGFTEWRNVGRALPQFLGHAQPRNPGDLGHYDLRNPQVMRDQADLAKAYGIGAFCFYFYWFGGRTLLEAPLVQWLQDDAITLPFCLCWANENWSRRWDGRADDILIGQRHSADDDLAFIAHVGRYLRDPRYLRVDGKPLLLVYRPGLLPDARATARRWRNWCLANGVGEICIAYTQSFDRAAPEEFGFDVAVEFPPNLATPTNITADQQLLNPGYRGQVLDWRELAQDYCQRSMPEYRLLPGVNCGWDNEARRPGQGRTYLHASPRRYGDWLRHTVHSRLASAQPSDRFVFINAWNEWAEGAALEPDARLGHAWLQATRTALRSPAEPAAGSPLRPCAVIHAWYPEVLDELLQALKACGQSFRIIVTTSPDKHEAVAERLSALGVMAEMVTVENRGRDILPFLKVADRLLDEGEQLILKLHTKRSMHRGNGDSWRRGLVDRLLAGNRAADIVRAFAHDAGLGLVAPEGHLLPTEQYLGGNRAHLDYLSTRLGLDAASARQPCFASGSMFWVRTAALRPLLDAHLDEWEFESESGQIDGTFAHAVERIFARCAISSGLKITTAAAVCGEPEPGDSQPYPFASRS